MMHIQELAAPGAVAEKSAKQAATRAGQTTPLEVHKECSRSAVQPMIAPACPYTGKRRYKSKSEALSVAKSRQADEYGPGRLRAYKCEYCDAWHLTSKLGGRQD